jgi:TolB-like protein/Tfp pilus assembly protein PilF
LAFLGVDPSPRAEDANEPPDVFAGKSQKQVWRYHAIPRVALRNLIAAALICIFLILVAGAKEWVTPSVGTNMVRRLAIFPVECPPGDQECEALGLALNRSLATQLTNTGGLDVVGPDIVAQFRAKRLPVLQVGAQLKVDHLITGTIEKHAGMRRLSVRIIRVADQAAQWAGHFESSWNTLPEIQSQLLNHVMVIVNRNRPATLQARLVEHFGARSADEQQRYARARHAIDTLVTVRERVYFDYAEKQLQSALKANPEFNDARILLAQLYYQEIWGAPQRSQLLKNSRLLLEAAIQKEPERAEVHALLGGVLAEAGHREQGMEFARRALMLGPLDSTPHRELARLYAEAGFFESALIEEDRALALDPSNLAALNLKIFLLSWMGKQAEADSALRALREWQPAGLADRLDADRELRTGNYVAANHLIATALEHTSNPVNTQASEIARALCAVLLGEERQAAEAFQRHPDQPPRFFDHYILLAAQLGEARRVVDYVRHNPLYFNYRYLVAEPRLAPVRSEPIFQALLEEAYRRWQSDLARYGPSLPAAPELRLRPTGTSDATVMASLAQRQGHAADPQNEFRRGASTP